ncbi:phytanoyl-CoA dioxygenase family protein [Pseudomonas plecoglossicida]|uniref:phytanoyl-CoA dioxygenase family protein n=1 Tax=Pseudomonas plecoglossicida TaxID=70775 RepID=UPI003977D955
MPVSIKDIGRYAALPWHCLQLATHAKSFENNPVLGSARLNALGLHVQRRQLAMAMAGYRRQALASRLAAPEREHFEQNGFFIRENALPAEQFAALRAELGALRSTGWEMRQGRAVTRRVSLDQDVLAHNPASAAFVADRGVRDLIAYASSNTGGITYQLQSIVIDAANADQDPQTRLHADTFHPTAKAWLFLDDVEDDQGPFSYVPGSHRLTPERLAWEYRQSLGAARSSEQMHREGSFRIDEPELAALGLPPPRRFAVPANTLVVADTSGFHARCASHKASHRVEIYASLRRNPFIPWRGAHLFALPWIANHHMRWDIRLKRWMGFGKKSHWKFVEQLNAYEAPYI